MRIFLSWLIHVIFVVLFFACPLGGHGADVLYDGRIGEAYGNFLRENISTAVSVQKYMGNPMEQFPEEHVVAAEVYDFQAEAICQHPWQTLYWYPQYVTAIVLAVREDCSVPITGWRSLLEQPVTVGLPMESPRMLLIVMAVSYGLTEDMQSAPGISYFQKLQQLGRLRTDGTYSDASYLHRLKRESAQVYITTDREAKLWQQEGQPLRIVVPQEGTLVFRKGLVSKVPLSFAPSWQEPLKTMDFLLTPGPPMKLLADPSGFSDNIRMISKEMKSQVFQRRTFETWTGIAHPVYYSGFLFLLVIWAGQIRRRMMSLWMKKIVSALLWVSLCWICHRILKFSIPPWEGDWMRYFWYGYYIFFSLFTFLAVLLSAGEPLSYRRWPLWLKVDLVGNIGLTLLVLTNDFHQWVFTFPEGLSVGTDIHGYGIGYALLMASYGGQFLWVNGYLYYRAWKEKVCSIPQCLPLLVSLCYVLYVSAYIQGRPWATYTELVIVTIFWAFLWLETLLDTHLFPANQGYGDFFSFSQLAMEIQDTEGHSIYRSPLVPTQVGDDVERMVRPLPGGQVVWYRNVQVLHEVERKLYLAGQALERSYQLDKKEEEIRRSYIRLLVEKRTMEELQDLWKTKGALLLRYTEFLQTAKPGNAADIAVSRLNVLASYIKKRSVMTLKGKEKQELPVSELKLSIEELFRYLKQTGLHGILECTLSGEMPIEKALALYDFIEQLSEAAVLGGETHFVCQVKQEKENYGLSVLLDHHLWVLGFTKTIREDPRLQGEGIRIHCKDLEYAYSVEMVL